MWPYVFFLQNCVKKKPVTIQPHWRYAFSEETIVFTFNTSRPTSVFFSIHFWILVRSSALSCHAPHSQWKTAPMTHSKKMFLCIYQINSWSTTCQLSEALLCAISQRLTRIFSPILLAISHCCRGLPANDREEIFSEMEWVVIDSFKLKPEDGPSSLKHYCAAI